MTPAMTSAMARTKQVYFAPDHLALRTNTLKKLVAKQPPGITADEWTDLGVCDPFTSVVVSPTRLFLARSLTFGPTALEGTEQIHCRKMPFSEAVQMVYDSRITHASSCLLILKTEALLR